MTNFAWGETSKNRMKYVRKDLITCATLVLERSKYDLTIPWGGGFRTEEFQKEIYEAGNSQIDGYKRKSYHQTGNALDIRPVGWTKLNKEELERRHRYIAALMFDVWQELLVNREASGTLRWGGNWQSFVDLAHFEVR